jgi:hypothetical protein
MKSFFKRDGVISPIKVFMSILWVYLFLTWTLYLIYIVLLLLDKASFISLDFNRDMLIALGVMIGHLLGSQVIDTLRQNVKTKIGGLTNGKNHNHINSDHSNGL